MFYMFIHIYSKGWGWLRTFNNGGGNCGWIRTWETRNSKQVQDEKLNLMRLYQRHVVSWIVDVKKDLNIYFGERKFHNHCIGNVINIWG